MAKTKYTTATPREERARRGRLVWEALQTRKTDVTREEMMNLLAFAGSKHPSTDLSNTLNYITNVKDERGNILFDEGEVKALINRRLAEKGKAPQEPTPAKTAQSKATPRTVTLGPFESWLMEAYARAAKKRNMTVQALMTSIVYAKAKDEMRRITTEIEKKTQAIRDELLQGIEIDPEG